MEKKRKKGRAPLLLVRSRGIHDSLMANDDDLKTNLEIVFFCLLCLHHMCVIYSLKQTI